ncbi:unnamed protein product [Cladocopium goreaui]|uniref:PAP-associated domain-containing protein n=1 Tax=Cladocopium goreaui TaxID=2562237 RepID=A0A9P1DTJ6_9DINO|nr:unnamed protein product [Cladocopium goreaui]
MSASTVDFDVGMKPVLCRDVDNVEEHSEGEFAPNCNQTGEETPETGTPLTRSLSPSSDGGASAADRSERAPSRRHQRKKRGASHESVDAGVSTVARTADASEAPDSVLEDLSESYQADVLRSSSDTEASVRGRKSTSRSTGGAKVARPKTVRPAGVVGHGFQVCPIRVMGFPQAPFGVSDFCLRGLFGSGERNKSFSDREIIKVLAAPPEKHQRLLETAKRLPEILMANDPPLANSAELYGSLALMTESAHWRDQDGPVCYVNGQSDVDFVVDMRKNVAPYSIVKQLCSKETWKLVGQVQVHKFSSTQFTLLGSFDEETGESKEAKEKVYLDLTCIESPLQFNRFKKRQEAFRKVFLQVRKHLEAKFGMEGPLAFDAYIHLLKAFAAKVPHSAISVYQAVKGGNTVHDFFQSSCSDKEDVEECISSSQIRRKTGRAGRLLSQAELVPCPLLFRRLSQDTETPFAFDGNALGYRRQSIDLSNGRLLARQITSWRSELYFRSVEINHLSTRADEWMNVTHSLDPQQVSMEALQLLERSFPVTGEDAFLLGAPPDVWLCDSRF